MKGTRKLKVYKKTSENNMQLIAGLKELNFSIWYTSFVDLINKLL